MANARRRTQRPNRTVNRNMAAGAAAAATLDVEDARSARSMNWQNELKYINGDLRQLLLISALLFILLFVVGFFL